MPVETVPAASLVLDFNLYPRLKISASNIRDLVDAAVFGAKIPPIIADRKSRRVVDGFHRVRAKLREGPDATIRANFHDYENEADILADAIRLNSAHGFKLNATDTVRIVHLAQGIGLDLERVADAMHTPVSELERRGKQIAVMASPSRRQVRNQEVVPLKRTFANLAGKSITPVQERANSQATGHPQSFLIQQVLNIIESGALDTENALVVARLSQLRDAINKLGLGRAA